MYLLPYPLEKYLPKINADNPDAGFSALIAKADAAPTYEYVSRGELWQGVSIEADSFTAIAASGDIVIAVASAGAHRIMRSTNKGATWSAISSFTTAILRAVCSNGSNVFVAVGDNVILRSDDYGITWSSVSPPEANSYCGISFGSGIFVAVSSDGTHRVIRSSNLGVTFGNITIPETNALQAITFGDNVFFAIASSGTHKGLRSTDLGLNWSVVTIPAVLNPIQNWRAATFGNGIFVAVGTGIIRSVDAAVSFQEISEVGGFGVSFGNDVFVMVSWDYAHQVKTSVDGATWTYSESAENSNWGGVTFSTDIFVAASSTGTNRIMQSIKDTLVTTKKPASILNLYKELINLYYLNSPDMCSDFLLDDLGAFVNAHLRSYDSVRTKRKKIYGATAQNKEWGVWDNNVQDIIDNITGLNSRILDSQNFSGIINMDGVGWAAAPTPNLVLNSKAIAAALNPNSEEVVVCIFSNSTNKAIRSDDGGRTWTTITLPVTDYWLDIAVNDDTYSTKDTYMMIGTNYVLVSTDSGQSFTDVTPPGYLAAGSALCLDVAYDIWVAISATKTFVSSDAGANWTTLTNIPEANSWNTLKSLHGIFIAISAGGTNRTMYSLDSGSTWNLVATPIAATWSRLAWMDFGKGDVYAFITSPAGKMLRSIDLGLTWTDISAASGPYSWVGIVGFTFGTTFDVLVSISTDFGTGASNLAHVSIDGGDTWVVYHFGFFSEPTENFVITAAYDKFIIFGGANQKIIISQTLGHIFIDCHNGINTGVLTANASDIILRRLKEELEHIVPIYMQGHLGYVDAGGLLHIYVGTYDLSIGVIH